MSTLEDAARAYVPALLALDCTDASGWTFTQAQYASAKHDLIVAAGYECTACEPDTCPGGFFSKSPVNVEVGEVL